jgi:molybdate/tungstate transport system substrate-binding protein
VDGCDIRPAAGGPRRAGALAAALVVLTSALAVCTAAGCSSSPSSSSGGSLSVIDAGSLIVPFEKAAEAYARAHPRLHVTTESHGSIQVIRQVSDLGRRFDVLASADAALIPVLMEDPLGSDATATADWYAVFATNRMVLAYSPTSQYAPLFRSGDWVKAVTTSGVRFGLADPRFDAAGYRALMVLQLAENLYDNDHLFEDLTVGRLSPPVTVSRRAGVDVIDVPELLDAVSGSGLLLRGASIELVALLESGDLDCAFEYESVVRQHELPFVRLPAQIDLSSPRYAASYERVAVAIAFQRFAKVKPEFRGAPIAYGVTIPLNAPDRAEAERFVAFLLGPDGRRILEAAYQPSVTPARVDHMDKLPAALRSLCLPLDTEAAPASRRLHRRSLGPRPRRARVPCGAPCLAHRPHRLGGPGADGARGRRS